jgi:hypothetical protein
MVTAKQWFASQEATHRRLSDLMGHRIDVHQWLLVARSDKTTSSSQTKAQDLLNCLGRIGLRIPTLPATISDQSPATWTDNYPAAFSDH